MKAIGFSSNAKELATLVKKGEGSALEFKRSTVDWKTFQTNYLVPLMAMGVLERTISAKPKSSLQRYRTTDARRETMKMVEFKR